MQYGKYEYKDIDIGLLKKAPYNLEERTEDEDIQWLVQTIAKDGFLENFVVIEPEDDEKYEIVCGNRRQKAAQLAGKRIIPCKVLSKYTTPAERRLINLKENVHRKDLTYLQQFRYLAEIMKAFNDNVPLVAQELSFPVSKVTDLLTYGRLPDNVKAAIKSADDFNNAMATVKLPEDKALELLQMAREKNLKQGIVGNIAATMEIEPEIKPEQVLQRIKSRGTKVSITLDGEWNDALTLAVARIDTTKQAYAAEALRQRLANDGFAPTIQKVAS